MSRTYKDSPNAKHTGPRNRRRRDISVQAVRRDPPDLRKLSRALIKQAMAEAEAEAQQAAPEQDASDPEPSADQERHG